MNVQVRSGGCYDSVWADRKNASQFASMYFQDNCGEYRMGALPMFFALERVNQESKQLYEQLFSSARSYMQWARLRYGDPVNVRSKVKHMLNCGKATPTLLLRQ